MCKIQEAFNKSTYAWFAGDFPLPEALKLPRELETSGLSKTRRLCLACFIGQKKRSAKLRMRRIPLAATKLQPVANLLR